MPVYPLPSRQKLPLPKSPGSNPYVVHDPCQGEGQFELNGLLFNVASGASVSFTLMAAGVITNTGNVELTVKEPGD